MAKREEWILNKKRNYENNLGDLLYSTLRPAFKENSKIEADLILN
jgi:hypothetical protein